MRGVLGAALVGCSLVLAGCGLLPPPTTCTDLARAECSAALDLAWGALPAQVGVVENVEVAQGCAPWMRCPSIVAEHLVIVAFHLSDGSTVWVQVSPQDGTAQVTAPG